MSRLIMVRKFLLLVLIPVAVIGVSLYYPLYTIRLTAPFYGERWISVSVYPTGRLVGEIDSINVINHYVGLGEIRPELIRELAYLPYLYGAFLILAVLTGTLRGRRYSLVSWTIFLVILAATPLYIYSWLYTYTHTIHPGAPIKIEPFNPPFFGYYKIANIELVSYLDIAFWMPLAALLIQMPPQILHVVRALRGRRS